MNHLRGIPEASALASFDPRRLGQPGCRSGRIAKAACHALRAFYAKRSANPSIPGVGKLAPAAGTNLCADIAGKLRNINSCDRAELLHAIVCFGAICDRNNRKGDRARTVALHRPLSTPRGMEALPYVFAEQSRTGHGGVSLRR